MGPTHFKVEWRRPVDECGIANHLAIRAMDKRQRWIATYFKGMCCERMTSRTESQNRVLKNGYVSESTSLHMFAKRMLDLLQHVDHMDASKTHYAQVRKKIINMIIIAMVTISQLLHCQYATCQKTCQKMVDAG